MKNKTDALNREAVGEGSVSGFERLPDSEIQNWRARKDRQLKWANLDDNEAMRFCENTEEIDQDMDGGFLPRNNYEDRN